MVISFVAPALFWETFVGYMYPWHHPRKLFCQARVLRSSAPSPSPTQTHTHTQKTQTQTQTRTRTRNQTRARAPLASTLPRVIVS